MTPRIVVTRALPGDVLRPLLDRADVWVSPYDRVLTRAELCEAVVGANALITTLNDRVDAEVMAAAGPGLQVVANTATGYDNLDVAAVEACGAVATNTPGVLVDATADLAIGLLLDVTRRVSEGDRLIRAGTAWSWDISFMLGSGLQGKRLGILGMGHIGRAVAHRAAAFGMEIVHSSRTASGTFGPSTAVDQDELLATSDVVSLHCPLTPQTRHLINSTALKRMKPSAYLINTARGPIVDEAALVEALASGRLAGAGLDVYEDEPAVNPALRTLDTVVLTPHLGSATVETREQMAELAVVNVVDVLDGRRPRNRIVDTRHG